MLELGCEGLDDGCRHSGPDGALQFFEDQTGATIEEIGLKNRQMELGSVVDPNR